MPRTQEELALLVASEVADERVVQAFRTTAREDFVPDDYRGDAYRDRPIPLPHSQTTSQPSLIARMVAAAAPEPGDKILEVGTGYGFQTALLARLADEVVSIERFDALARAARDNLAAVGIDNVDVVVGDGWEGYEPRAPFDAIVVSAAAESVPDALSQQLRDGGRLVIPVTRKRSDDVLLFVKRGAELEERRLITPARFVPLVHGAEHP